LLDCGLSPERFAIDAVDISTRAIAHAQEGIYGRNSFRGSDLTFRDRYFEHTPGGYRLSSHVRDLVRLRSANLFAAGAFAGVECYDVIFCRNVLIYFDRPVQRKAVEILRSLMTADGVMFVGPAESALLTESGLTPARMPHAFAFRRAREVPPKTAPNPASAAAARACSPPESRRSRPRAEVQHSPERKRAAMPGPAAAAAPAPRPPADESVTAPGEVPWMGLARRLADQGRVAEALQLCEQGLRASAPSAQAFYLLGLLHDAAGRPQQAGEHYRKALYLEPSHEEALVHLAALLKGEGDTGGAERLLDRARRRRTAGGG
jgi:chemotaxis protein methyltransferase WspC